MDAAYHYHALSKTISLLLVIGPVPNRREMDDNPHCRAHDSDQEVPSEHGEYQDSLDHEGVCPLCK